MSKARKTKDPPKAGSIYRAGKAPSWAKTHVFPDIGVEPLKANVEHDDTTAVVFSLDSHPIQAESSSAHSAIAEQTIDEAAKDDGSDSDSSSESSSDFDFDAAELTVPEPEVVQVLTKQEMMDSHIQKTDEGLSKDTSDVSITQSQPSLSNPVESAVLEDESSDSESSSEDSGSSEESSESSSSSSAKVKRRRRRKEFVHLRKDERDRIEHLMRKQKGTGGLLSMEEELEAMEQAREAREKRLVEISRDQLITLLKDRQIRELNELNQQGCGLSDADMDAIPSDGDHESEGGRLSLAEDEAWQMREMKRLLRDFEEDLRITRIELGESPFNSDAEIQNDEHNQNTDRVSDDEPKRNQRKFLQKYYHSGVFFDDDSVVENELRARDFGSAATGKDAWMDYDAAPTAMKRKRFGLMSQSKWTHLAAEDTTDRREDYEFGIGSYRRKKGRDHKPSSSKHK